MEIPDKTPAAAPWALLWLTGFTGVSWLALIASERFASLPPTTPTAAEPPQPTDSRRGDVVVTPPQPQPVQGIDPLSIALGPLDTGLADPVQPMSSATPLPPLAVQTHGWSAPPLPTSQFAEPAAAAALTTGRQRPTPPSASHVSGALLLGGPLGLASLNEKAMVPAAMVERARRLASPDRLQALPLHWRADMDALLRQRQSEQVMPAEVVRLPVPHLSRPQEIPLAVRSDGADTTVQPASPRSQRAIEHWMERQPAPAQGQVRPLVLVLEPIPAETPVEASSTAPAPAEAPVAVPEASPQPAASVPQAAASPSS